MGKFNLPEDQIEDWKTVWADKLKGLTRNQILGALKIVDDHYSWPPTPAEFRKLIEPEINLDYEGMFKNAANAISTQKWPDALTYHAACQFGIFELRSATLSNTNMTRWKEIVERLKDQDLSLPDYNEDQLPAPGQTHNAELAKSELGKLKEMLSGNKQSSGIDDEGLGQISEIASGSRFDDERSADERRTEDS